MGNVTKENQTHRLKNKLKLRTASQLTIWIRRGSTPKTVCQQNKPIDSMLLENELVGDQPQHVKIKHINTNTRMLLPYTYARVYD